MHCVVHDIHLFSCTPITHQLHTNLQQEKSKANRAERLKAKRAARKTTKHVGKEFYKSMIQDAPYQGEDYEVFSTWLGTTQ